MPSLRKRIERLEKAAQQKQSRTCKHCRHFNWKVSAVRNWGECINPKVQAATRLSLVLVSGLGHEQLNQVSKFGRLQFDEDVFGCIMFERDDAHRLSKA